MRILVGNWALAVGIDWSLPHSDTEIQVVRRENAGGHYVLASDLQQKWLGVHEKMDGKTYAAALFIAQVEPNCVVRMSVNDSNCWVCSIFEGKPIVGRDRIVSNSEANTLMHDWSNIGTETVLITDLPGVGKGINRVIEAIEDAIKTKQISTRQLSGILLRPTSLSLATPVIKYGMVVCSIASVCLVAYSQHWLTKIQAPDLQTTRASQAAQAQLVERGLAEINAQKQKALLKFQADIAATQMKYRDRTDPEQLWAQVSTIRAQLPLAYLGYKPQVIDCGVRSCKVAWLGSGRFTVMSDKTRLPNVDGNMTPDFTATSTFALEPATTKVPTIDVPTVEKFQFWMSSAVAAQAGSLQLSPLKPVTVTPPATAQAQPIAAAYVGTWHAQLTSPSAVLDLTYLMRFIARMPMRITSIRNSKLTHSFDIEGDYVFVPTLDN